MLDARIPATGRGLCISEAVSGRMENLKTVVESPALLATFLFCAAVPAVTALAVLREFSVPLKDRLTFWKKLGLATFGALLAELIAVLAYTPAEAKWCADMTARGTYCDGQGPMILIFSVPLCAVLASCISSSWSWYRLRPSAKSPWAAVFSYRSPIGILNIGVAVAIQMLYWGIFALTTYWFTLHLLEGF
jgi:hypothetical protein